MAHHYKIHDGEIIDELNPIIDLYISGNQAAALILAKNATEIVWQVFANLQIELDKYLEQLKADALKILPDKAIEDVPSVPEQIRVQIATAYNLSGADIRKYYNPYVERYITGRFESAKKFWPQIPDHVQNALASFTIEFDHWKKTI